MGFNSGFKGLTMSLLLEGFIPYDHVLNSKMQCIMQVTKRL